MRLWWGLAAASALFLAPLLFVPLVGASQRVANGDAWQPTGLRGQTVLQMEVTSSEGETILYAHTASGLWRRTGASGAGAWQQIDAGLPRSSLGAPQVAAWRLVYGRPLQLYVLAGPNDERQLYRTDDGGASWMAVGPAPGQGRSPVMAIVPGVGGAHDTILIATQTRLQRSTDGGATWTPGGAWPDGDASGAVDGEPVQALFAEASAPDQLLALAHSGALWISDSGGLSWHAAETGFDVSAVALAPYFGLRVWAAGHDLLAYSGDSAATWMRYDGPSDAAAPWGELGGPAVALRVDPRVSGTVYAALAGGAVYRTDDGGVTWASLGVPGSTRVTGLHVEPDGRGLVYAATEDGVWVRRVVPLQPTPEPTLAATATPALAATVAPAPTQTRTSTATATLTATPLPAATATVAPTATPSPTATATATATTRPARRPSVTPSASPQPTATSPVALPTAPPTAPPVGPTDRPPPAPTPDATPTDTPLR